MGDNKKILLDVIKKSPRQIREEERRLLEEKFFQFFFSDYGIPTILLASSSDLEALSRGLAIRLVDYLFPKKEG